MLWRIPGENIQNVPKFANILETLRRFLPQESLKTITVKSSYFAQQYKKQIQTQIVFEILRCRCEQCVALLHLNLSTQLKNLIDFAPDLRGRST
jgi:hypothetical protein